MPLTDAATQTALDYGDRPMVLVVADQAERRSRAERLVAAFEGRVAGSVSLEEAPDRLDRQAALSAVFLDATSADAVTAEPMFERLDTAASAGRFRSIVTISPALIDLASARLTHRDVTLLCDASVPDQLLALATILAPASTRLNDLGGEGARNPLEQLSEEVGRISRLLTALSSDERGAIALGDRRQTFAIQPLAETIDAPMVRGLIRARRMREHYFAAELFADPAWDILLDLMAARLERRQVAVSSLCIAAAVPPTTALRWIKTLTDIGLIVRAADPADGRRIFIALSEKGASAMLAYLAAARRSGPLGA